MKQQNSLISDGDGRWESECGRVTVERRYDPGGWHMAGWGVYTDGNSNETLPFQFESSSFAESRKWAKQWLRDNPEASHE